MRLIVVVVRNMVIKCTRIRAYLDTWLMRSLVTMPYTPSLNRQPSRKSSIRTFSEEELDANM